MHSGATSSAGVTARWLGVVMIGLGILLTAPYAAAQTSTPEDENLWNQAMSNAVGAYQSGDYEAAANFGNEAVGLSYRIFGRKHLNTAQSLNNYAVFLHLNGEVAASIGLQLQSLAIREDQLDPGHEHILHNIADLARSYEKLSQWDNADHMWGKLHDKSDPNQNLQFHFDALEGLITTAEARGNYPRVAGLMEKLVPLRLERTEMSDAEIADLNIRHGTVLELVGDLSGSYRAYSNAVALRETVFGPDALETASALNSLGHTLWLQDRNAEARKIHTRAHEIRKHHLGELDTTTLESLHNIALVMNSDTELAEKIEIQEQVLEISSKVEGIDSQSASRAMNNLAFSLEANGQIDEAIALFRRALEADKKTLGLSHPDTGIAMQNLAEQLANHSGTLGALQAKYHFEQAIELRTRVLGKSHPDTIQSLDALAALQVRMGNAEAARQIYDSDQFTAFRKSASKDDLRGFDFVFIASAVNVLRHQPERLTDAFEILQTPMINAANDAIATTSIRLAARSPELAEKVRKHQLLNEELQVLEADALVAFSGGDGNYADDLQPKIETISTELARLEGELSSAIPEFSKLSVNRLLKVEQVVSLLKEGEALALIEPGYRRSFGDEVPGLIFVIRWDGAVKASVLEAGYDLQIDAARLRCQISPEGQMCDDYTERGYFDTRGNFSLGAKESAKAVPKFDFELPHDLYRRIFGEVETAFAGIDHLILVTDDTALGSLPFQVLLTEAPEKTEGEAAFRNASWLINRHALTSLPSVSALQALRQSNEQKVRRSTRFLGIGDPVIGTRPQADCQRDYPMLMAGLSGSDLEGPIVRSAGGSTSDLFARSGGDGIADVEAVRALRRLPDTRCELIRISESLGDGDLLLDHDASESKIKEWSKAGRLKQYSVLSFATHGLVAGEINATEPALVLTPPDEGTFENDGLLTASEIAQLDLNADWVLLSACNTAAGKDDSLENLSGLARAFFFAGAKTVLVSNWPVNSIAATTLTTRAFETMRLEPSIGRSEALRRSMLAVITDPNSSGQQLHPRFWAPFSVVGEGLAGS